MANDQYNIINSNALEFLHKEQSDKYNLIYIDPPYFSQRNFGEFKDTWKNVSDYIKMLKPTLIESKRILQTSGNICVHVDWHASHHVRVALEDVFGSDCFRNEIAWCYSSGGASKRHFSRKHDSIFVYAKDADLCKFNTIREPYPRDYGGRAGFHPQGRVMNDWWRIGIMSTTAKERNGYPTQKPIELLQRLITAYTDKGDIVLDYFCGSGTTGEAALSMDRRCVLVDQNPNAIQITADRLSKTNV